MAKTKKKDGHPSAESADAIQTSLLELFIGEIKDIYWAENHLVMALPKMQKAAASAELQNAFATHLEQTKGHVKRLEKVFGVLNEKVLAKKCDAMEGLVEEGEGLINDTAEGTVARDLGLIMAAQKVEHYEIATYASLVHLATTLGQTEISSILSETLSEEKETDELLKDIAENEINYNTPEQE